jgi:hypothetical protein
LFFIYLETSSLPKVQEESGTMLSSEHKMPIKTKYSTFDHNGNLEIQPQITNSPPRLKLKELTRSIYLLLITFTFCIAALFLSLKVLGNEGTILNPPFTTPPKDWSGFKNQSWAVGIDPSAGYATASAAFNNGTVGRSMLRFWDGWRGGGRGVIRKISPL